MKCVRFLGIAGLSMSLLGLPGCYLNVKMKSMLDSSSSIDSPTPPIAIINPTVSITSPTGQSVISGSFPVALSFSKSISGMDSSQVVVTNGTIANFMGSETSYTFDVIPTGEGLVQVSLSTAIIKDLDGNALAPVVDLTKYNDVSPVNVSFSQYSAVASEGNTTVSGVLTLSGSKPYPISVTLDLFGSAVEGFDYTFTNKTVIIPANSLSANFLFDLRQNGLVSAEKILSISPILSDSSKVIIASPSVTNIIIQDTDGAGPNTVVDVALSKFTTCARLQSGLLKCWGDNLSGQYGNGSTTSSASPTAGGGGTSYIYAAGGGLTNCGITSSNVLRCWGDNGWGLVGDGTYTQRYTPVTIDSGTGYLKVALAGSSSGNYAGCAITTTNDMKCWGSNASGSYGDGTFNDSLTPVLVRSGRKYRDVVVNGINVCGITTVTDAIECAGSNSFGELGDGTFVDKNTPVTIDPGVPYQMMTSGENHHCGITMAGVLKCWGYNFFGNLGTGDKVNRNLPTVIDPGVTYAWVSAGEKYTCGVTTNNELKCWGANTNGQLGSSTVAVGPTSFQLTPLLIDPGVQYTKVFAQRNWTGGASDNHTCGITLQGSLKCWGANLNWQLGYKSDKLDPVMISSGSYVDIKGGNGAFCAMDLNGKLFCWGNNSNYVLLNQASSYRQRPYLSTPDTSYSIYSMGFGSACGITAANELYCWGSNSNHQLADGTTVSKSVPVIIDSGVSYQMVSAGLNTCAITSAGVLKCWGYNNYGQVGDGTTIEKTTPTVIDSGTTYKYVSTSGFGTCAITTAGLLKCWGVNSSGQIGNGTTTNSSVPVTIDSGTTYVSVETNGSSTCGLSTLGVLKCWGNNLVGQLGIGSTINKTTPTVVTGTFKKFRATGNVACAINTSDDLYCWGSNGYGDLANPTWINRTTPSLVDSGVKYLSIYPKGGEGTCGVTLAGKLKCWGLETGYSGYISWLPTTVTGLQF